MNEVRPIPNYYVGKFKMIRAKDVITDFELSYNVGTSVTYLLRAGKKDISTYREDIEKAIHHLQFELEQITLREVDNLVNKK